MKKDAHSVVVADFEITFTWTNGADFDYVVRRASSPPEAIRKALLDVCPVADAFTISVAVVPNTERRISNKQYLERVKAGADPFDDKFFDQKG